MYVFLFVLAPLAIVIAWALARDRRRRRYIRGADIHSGVESAKDQATRWTLRITQDEQGALFSLPTRPSRAEAASSGGAALFIGLEGRHPVRPGKEAGK